MRMMRMMRILRWVLWPLVGWLDRQIAEYDRILDGKEDSGL